MNNRRVKVASFQIKVGDVVEVSKKARDHMRIQVAQELAEQRHDAEWIEVSKGDFSGSMKRLPEMQELPQEFKVNMVVEFYSK